MGTVSIDSRSMENCQERISLDGSSYTTQISKQNSNQSTSITTFQSDFRGPLQQTTIKDHTRDDDGVAKEGLEEDLGISKFAFPRKVKRYFWSFFSISHKEKHALKIRKINLLNTVSIDLKTISRMQPVVPGISAMNYKFPTFFSSFKEKMKYLEAFKSFIKYSNMMPKVQKYTKNGTRIFEETPFNIVSESYPTRRISYSQSYCIIQKLNSNICKDSNGIPRTNVSIVRLKSTQSHAGYVSLTSLQKFLGNVSKSKNIASRYKSQNSKFGSKCGKSDENSRKIRKQQCKDESKYEGTCQQQKNTCRRDDDKCVKQRHTNSKQCKPCPQPRPQPRSQPCPCPRTQKAHQCPDGKETRQKCNAKDGSLTRGRTRQSQDRDCSKKHSGQSMTCKQTDDCDKQPENCMKPPKRKEDCHRKSKCEKNEICPKNRNKCAKNQRSKSCTKIDSCQTTTDKSKPDNCSRKRHYSQLSFRSNSLLDNRSYSTSILFDTRRNNVFPRFYSDSSKEEFCGKPDTKPRKCEKTPTQSLSKKLPAETCQPIQEDKKPLKRNMEEYCSNKKKAKGKNLEKETMQQQINRELKEVEECTKDLQTKRKKNDKGTSLKLKLINLDRVINFYKQQKQAIDKKNYNSACSKLTNLSCGPNIVKSGDGTNNNSNEMSAITKLVSKELGLFNKKFGRLFSIMQVNQDNFGIKQTAGCSKIFRNNVNDDDFIHGDELPLFVEIDNEEEETSDCNTPSDRSISDIN